MKKTLFVLLVSIIIFTSIYSQTWEVFTKENSELNSSVFSEIIVDGSNIAWIGTGLGLAKIDGNNLSLYDNSNSILTSNFVTDLFLDKNNIIWILYKDKIYKMVNRNFELFRNDIGGNEIVVDRENQIYLANGPNILKLDVNNDLDTLYKPINNNNPIKDLIIDKKGYLWFSTYDNFGSIFMLNADTTIEYNSQNINYEMSAINCLAIDSTGNIWISGMDMLLKYDIEFNKWTNMIEKYFLDINKQTSFNAIAFDNKNNLQLVSSFQYTTPATLYSFIDDKPKITNFDSLYLEDMFVKTQDKIAIDSAKNYFIVAPDYGIFKFNEAKSTVSTFEENNIKLYPNPTDDVLYIDLSDKHVLSYSITDITGKILKQDFHNFKNQITIDTKSLTTGIYFINLKLSDNQTIQSKFVKE